MNYFCYLDNRAYKGAAIYAEGTSSTTVKVYAENSILQGNSANDGGGMYIWYGTVTLTSTTFASNSAEWGGGMYIEYGTVTLTSTTFASNSAGSDGGGMRIRYGTATLTSTTFASNSAKWGGGGGMRILDGTVTLTSSTFASNSAAIGGGMSIYGDSSDVTTLRQCSFISNTASQGHAIYTYKSSPTIAVINTNFSDPNDNNNIYVYYGSWKTCSSPNVCTEAPFNGTCSAVNNSNVGRKVYLCNAGKGVIKMCIPHPRLKASGKLHRHHYLQQKGNEQAAANDIDSTINHSSRTNDKKSRTQVKGVIKTCTQQPCLKSQQPHQRQKVPPHR